MILVGLLILLPLLAAVVLLAARNSALRNALVVAASVAVAGLSLALLATGFTPPRDESDMPVHLIDRAMLAAEIAIGLFLLYLCVKHRRYFVGLLVVAQTALMVWFEAAYGGTMATGTHLFADKFSVIMALIIGIPGSLIAVYSLGYMREYHEHQEGLRDKRPVFFFLIFLFLSAMFGIVFSNHLGWLYFFWEITTLCSFLLIGYSETREAVENSFKALLYNLIGGLSMALGVIWFHVMTGGTGLDQMLAAGQAAALLPAVLIGVGGLAKSAQLPFSSWLLGAMVAPTPVSALLHSSTMVKAGVYVVVRMAPVFAGTKSGLLIGMVGGLTFLLASVVCIAQRDAKRLLAYSTIANLGLIVMCGGIGTYEAVWAAVLLIVFHAVTKCLLFLCVGTIEHRLGSRDIESMGGLVMSMPRTSVLLQVGIAGMFLAPFGMLISKWAVLKALVDCNPAVTGFVIFGSAATLFVWVKWLGKLIEVVHPLDNAEEDVPRSEVFSLHALALITVGICAGYPVISSLLIEPYVLDLYGHVTNLGRGNIVIMLIMLGMVGLFPLSFRHYGRNVKVLDAYLGGANTQGSRQFRGSAGAMQDVTLTNYYLADFIDEKRINRVGFTICLVLIAVAAGVSLP
jgi:ech hydrogenase subunit A